MKSNLERSKWFPLFIMAVILLFIYNLMGNFTSVTSEIMRFLSIISPLLYGILFSYFLYMPHQLFERLMRKTKVGFIVKRARIFATLLTLVFMLGVLVLVISFLLPVLITSVFDLATSIPGYVAFVTSFLNNLPEEGFWAYFDVLEVVTDNAGAMLAQVFNAATIESFAMGIISFASQLLNIVLGLIISLYVLLERERIGKFLKAMSKALFRNNTVRRNRVNRYMDQIHKVLFTFIASKGLDSIINFVVVTTMLLIFDVPYALLLGILAGVFNFIPYLGSLIAVITIAAITIITGGFTLAVQVIIPLFIFQQLDGNYIEPRIMKSSLKISPILVIIAVLIGGAYFGVAGMFLAVPIAVIIKQMLIEYTNNAEESDADAEALESEGGAEEPVFSENEEEEV